MLISSSVTLCFSAFFQRRRSFSFDHAFQDRGIDLQPYDITL